MLIIDWVSRVSVKLFTLAARNPESPRNPEKESTNAIPQKLQNPRKLYAKYPVSGIQHALQGIL